MVGNFARASSCRQNVGKCPKKPNPPASRRIDKCAELLAEEVGFEPTEAFTSTVFKTVALNRSATPPVMWESS